MKGKLNAIYNALQTNYIFTTLSPHDIKKWTHPKTLQYFNFTGNISHRNIASGLFGVNYNVFWVKDLVEDWAVCGMHLECISPKGSTRKNHRQDQAALTKNGIFLFGMKRVLSILHIQQGSDFELKAVPT
eukprot:587879_1